MFAVILNGKMSGIYIHIYINMYICIVSSFILPEEMLVLQPVDVGNESTLVVSWKTL